MEFARRQKRFDLLPERDDEVYSRRNDSTQKRDFLVQIVVVAFINDRHVQDPLQLSEIHDVTRFRIRLSAHRDFKNVVVPMPVWIGAQPVLFHVPSLAFRRIMEPMRSVKMNLPGDMNRSTKHLWGRTEG